MTAPTLSERQWQQQVQHLARLYRWRVHHCRPAQARSGRWSTPIWSHPAVHDTVKAMGGIRVFALSDNLMAERAHFLRLYETCKARAERAKQLPSDEHVRRMLEVLGDVRAIEGPAS